MSSEDSTNEEDYTSEDLEDDLDTTYTTNQEDQNKDLLAFLGTLGLLSLVSVLKTQNPRDLQIVSERINSPTSPTAGKLPGKVVVKPEVLDFTQQLFPDVDRAAANIIAHEGMKYLDNLESIFNKIKGLHTVEWPGYIENLEYRNMTLINNRLGMFGAVESTKQGTLTAYQESESTFVGEIRIPWNTAHDENVCHECLGLEEKGPYPPDAYPAPPHNGCRCKPGDPVVIYNTDMFKLFRTI